MTKENMQPGAEQQHKDKKPEAPVAKKGKEHTPIAGNCHSWGCKAASHRFDFCDEHYSQFKFGLIKKSGEPVSDYERKLEHYNAWRTKHGLKKVA